MQTAKKRVIQMGFISLIWLIAFQWRKNLQKILSFKAGIIWDQLYLRKYYVNSDKNMCKNIWRELYAKEIYIITIIWRGK